MLYKHALSIGEDKEWLDRVFGFARGSRDAKVVHVAGHRTHYHVRFFNAGGAGARAPRAPAARADERDEPAGLHRAARREAGSDDWPAGVRYGTTVRAIQQANGLKTTQLRAGRAYQIPRRGAAAPKTDPLVVPQRLLPPSTPEILSAVPWPTVDSLDGPAASR